MHEYDALGRRIVTVDYTDPNGGACGTPGSPVATRHIYSGIETIEEYVCCSTAAPGCWTLAREFVWGGGFPEPIALIDHTGLGDKAAETAEILHYRKVGQPRTPLS